MPRGPEGCPTEPFPHPEDWHHDESQLNVSHDPWETLN